jgi:hypothetical protein
MESKANDVYHMQNERDQAELLRCVSFNTYVLAEGSNANTIKTQTNTVVFTINGVFCSKAPLDNIAMTACVAQAINKRCRYLISIDVNGAVTITKGTEVRVLTTGAIATLSWDSLNKKLKDSASSLGSFKAGDKILVSGFTYAANNGIFSVERVDKDGAFLIVSENRMVDEIEGDSVTVLISSPLPDLPYGQAPMGSMTIITGTTAFTVGTNDITSDIGTGSVAFANFGIMPLE